MTLYDYKAENYTPSSPEDLTEFLTERSDDGWRLINVMRSIGDSDELQLIFERPWVDDEDVELTADPKDRW